MGKEISLLKREVSKLKEKMKKLEEGEASKTDEWERQEIQLLKKHIKDQDPKLPPLE
jgi:FtsZ-binding cell division protein ZapB